MCRLQNIAVEIVTEKCDRWTDRQTDRRTDIQTDRQKDGQTTDKVIPMCRYASQATQKIFLEISWEMCPNLGPFRFVFPFRFVCLTSTFEGGGSFDRCGFGLCCSTGGVGSGVELCDTGSTVLPPIWSRLEVIWFWVSDDTRASTAADAAEVSESWLTNEEEGAVKI